MYNFDHQLFLALNFDGGPVLDRLMLIVSGTTMWHTFEIGNFDDFTASKNSIALSINGCSTKSAGALTLVDGAFPAIAAEKNLAIRYKAKVSASEAVTNINAATVIFTIAAVMEG